MNVRTSDHDAWAALGDRRRREIYGRLSERPMTVVELAGELPISQPAVSQHLKVLREADLVTFVSRGTSRVYEPTPDGLTAMRAELDRFWSRAMHNFKEIADAEAAQRKEQP